MGTLKIELDIPEFKKEVSLNITVRKDGEVLTDTTVSPVLDNKVTAEIPSETPKETSKKRGKTTGNLMGIEI
jgi:hypothetical protein